MGRTAPTHSGRTKKTDRASQKGARVFLPNDEISIALYDLLIQFDKIQRKRKNASITMMPVVETLRVARDSIEMIELVEQFIESLSGNIGLTDYSQPLSVAACKSVKKKLEENIGALEGRNDSNN